MINGPAGYDPIQGGMRTEMKAGPGIDISNGTISTTGEAGVPYVGGTGIYIHGATVEADLAAGYRTEISGSTIGQLRYMPIETVTGSSVTMQAGHAYKIYATSAAVTLNTETIPVDSFGLEGHLEIYVAGTGYVITGTNVVLANALEPDSVNNLTARFHDGICILSVEDHVAGYIVTVNAASGAGSLAYGLSTSTNEYIAVDASLNGQTLDLAGVTTYAGEKHFVGNGPEETIISGSINCTSKTTVANLSLQDVTITGGVMTLGDAYIPSGSTVAVSGGRIHAEKVAGGGGTINLNGTNIYEPNGAAVSITSCTITGGSTSLSGGAFTLPYGALTAKSVRFIGNIATSRGGAIDFYGNTVSLQSCYFSGNLADVNQTLSNAIMTQAASVLIIDACDFEDEQNIRIANSNTRLDIYSSNTLKNRFGGDGSANIHSGSVLDLTGNTNATPIALGGIVFEQGGATIKYGTTGSPSSCTIDGATVTPYLGNDGSFVSDSSHNDLFGSATVSNLTFKGTASFRVNGNYTLSNCAGSQTLGIQSGCSARISGTYSAVVITGTNGTGTLELADGAVVTMTNASESTAIAQNVGTVVVGSGCTINGNTITPGTYTSATIKKDGTITEA